MSFTLIKVLMELALNQQPSDVVAMSHLRQKGFIGDDFKLSAKGQWLIKELCTDFKELERYDGRSK